MAKRASKQGSEGARPLAKRPPAPWSCPRCARSFSRANQRHACGTSDGGDILRGRPQSVVSCYAALRAVLATFGPVETVERERYALFRTTRIFADAVIMADCVRIAIHLDRQVDDPRFFKIVADRNKVTHVAKLHTPDNVDAIAPYLRAAYEASVRAP